VDQEVIDRAMERVAASTEDRMQTAEMESALERAREGLEALAVSTAELEESLPEKIGAAVRDGIGSEARPVARQLAEVRGLMNQVLRRLERLEGDVRAERHARIDDLALLVDLITSGWKSVDTRLENFERHLTAGGDAVVYRIEERRANTPT
jgi:hypothetical protein